MIHKAILDSVKLANPSNFASVSDTELAVERAVSQGSQGWGVGRADAVILRLTDELRVAEELATKYDECYKQLKGTQMENGRLKAAAERALEETKLLERELSNLKDQLKVAKEHLHAVDKSE